MGEFELIERYFGAPTQALATPAIVAGIGDDCAVLQPAPGAQLAISCDLLIEGRHFMTGCDPYRLGHKSLAVSLSDLAACGAAPLGFTLALALPTVDEAWLAPFSEGMLALARASDCPLVGGDTTAGPLAINVTVFGQLPQGQALLRSGARVDHDVFVTGAIGEARAGLGLLQDQWQCADAGRRKHLLRRLEAPTPRLEIGRRLRGVASSAIDLSDGLRGDIGHILRASNVAARLNGEALLETAPRLWATTELASWPVADRIAFAMAGGDDYELLFTAHPGFRAYLKELGQELGVGIQRIGEIVAAEPGQQRLQVFDADGQPVALTVPSFEHFAGN